MTDATPLPRAHLVRGILLGLAAALSWGLYNVGVEIGHASGFHAADLTLLRYGVAAILLAPVALYGLRGHVTLWQVAVLSALIGPGFAMLLNTGFSMAPLAHAVVIAPGMSMLTANTLERLSTGRPLSLNRRVGMAILLLGLMAIAADQPPPKTVDGSVLLGDLCFVASGTLWGTFTWLMGRWKLPPVRATAGIATLSTAIFLPIYLIVWGVTPLPAHLWVEQALYQGAIGGCLAFVFYAAAVGMLGAGRAALFSALVPPTAVLLAIPIAAQVPGPLQWAGVALVSIGLSVSLELVGRHLKSLR